ncbi:MAG: zinc-binding dehydrogenase [Acidimicrobiales bacterium]
MRASVLRSGRAPELAEVDDPVPGAGQVLVRSRACGLCGSDVHFAELVGAGPDDVDEPAFVLGHEFCVEVLDYGPGTDPTVPVGALACSVPYATGPGGPELLGFSANLGGALAEHLVLDAARLVAVPSGLAPEHACLTEPLAVGRHAAGLGHLDHGQPAVIVGAGPVGLAVLLALKADGHGPVLVAEPSPVRRARAERLGADVVVDPGEGSPFAHLDGLGVVPGTPSPLWDEPGPRTPAVTVFECVGRPGMLQPIVDGVPVGSRVVVVGAGMEPDPFTPATGVYKEVEVVYSFAYRPREFARSLADLADGRVPADQLVTATVGLGEVAGALDALRADPAQVKVVVLPDR